MGYKTAISGDSVMYLSVHCLANNETVTTGVRVENTSTIRAIRLGLYKHDTPDGTLTITLKDGSLTIGSASVTMADLDVAVGTYFHGYVRFDSPNAGWRVNVNNPDDYLEMTLEISLTGHTNDNNNYIALQKQIEGAFVDPYGVIRRESSMSPEQLTHFQPLMIEIYKNS